MPFTVETTEPDTSRQLLSKTGGPLEKGLIAPVYENKLNNEEREVAVYLDGEQALAWWHRNVARTQYGLQGWKKAKIYPDFIFAVQNEGKAKRITVLETKGDQLDNLDTAYKRELLSFLSDNFRWDDYTPAGELELVTNDGTTVEATLILMSEWKAKLPKLNTLRLEQHLDLRFCGRGGPVAAHRSDALRLQYSRASAMQPQPQPREIPSRKFNASYAENQERQGASSPMVRAAKVESLSTH